MTEKRFGKLKHGDKIRFKGSDNDMFETGKVYEILETFEVPDRNEIIDELNIKHNKGYSLLKKLTPDLWDQVK